MNLFPWSKKRKMNARRCNSARYSTSTATEMQVFSRRSLQERVDTSSQEFVYNNAQLLQRQAREAARETFFQNMQGGLSPIATEYVPSMATEEENMTKIKKGIRSWFMRVKNCMKHKNKRE